MKKETAKSEPDPVAEEPMSDESQPETASAKTRLIDKHKHHWHNFRLWYATHKKWSIPGTLLALIIILAAIPLSRYAAAGLVLKNDLTVQVNDSTAHTPVSGATVSVGGVSVQTNGNGQATLHHVKVGNHKVSISKKYYDQEKVSLLTPILKQKHATAVQLVANGRQVKISVTNIISKNAVAGVNIKVADITAKTDKNGQAIVVLPVGITSQKATLSLTGYNGASVTVKVSNSKIQENDYTLTPAGQVYFLSKLSGTIDVVKTNLDGSDRQTVLAGTGNENDRDTVLLASKDWKYLALLASRAADAPALYLINTSNDSLSVIDSGDATFNPVGWSNDNFIYTVDRNNFSPTQAGGEALKSYNAPNDHLNVLDQTKAGGNDINNWAHEDYGQVYVINKVVVYSKTWNTFQHFVYDPSLYDNKQSAIYSVGIDGTNPQTLRGFTIASDKHVIIQSIPHGVDQVYFQVTDPSGTSYYAYANGKVSDQSDLSDTFNAYYSDEIFYLRSPSGNTFWGDRRDGKETLFVGDQDAGNAKQVATLSDYLPYGWYTDNYLLVSKGGSELYVMPASGIKKDSNALKISDYLTSYGQGGGYQGGYGGL